MDLEIIEKLTLNEKKKQVHKVIDEQENVDFLDKVLEFYEINLMKIDREPKNGITAEKLLTKIKKHIETLPWEK